MVLEIFVRDDLKFETGVFVNQIHTRRGGFLFYAVSKKRLISKTMQNLPGKAPWIVWILQNEFDKTALFRTPENAQKCICVPSTKLAVRIEIGQHGP